MQTYVRLRFQHRSDAPKLQTLAAARTAGCPTAGAPWPGQSRSSFHRCRGISCIVKKYPPLWFNETFTRLIHWFTMIYIDSRLPSKDDSACTLPWKGYKVPTKVRSNQDRETVPAFWDDQTPPTYSQPSTKHWLKDSLTLPWNVPDDPCRSEKKGQTVMDQPARSILDPTRRSGEAVVQTLAIPSAPLSDSLPCSAAGGWRKSCSKPGTGAAKRQDQQVPVNFRGLCLQLPDHWHLTGCSRNYQLPASNCPI